MQRARDIRQRRERMTDVVLHVAGDLRLNQVVQHLRQRLRARDEELSADPRPLQDLVGNAEHGALPSSESNCRRHPLATACCNERSKEPELPSVMSADSTATNSTPKSRTWSSTPYSCAWSRTCPISTVQPEACSKVIPLECGLEALAQPSPQHDAVPARGHARCV